MDRTISADTTLEVLWDVAVDVLRGDAAGIVCDDAVDGTIQLGATIAGTDVTRHGNVEVGELRELDVHAAVLPVTWGSVGHEHRFPTVTGIFELSAVSEHPPLTRLAFVGHHEAPLGILGTIGDAAGGRALATRSIQALTERVGVWLTDAVAVRAGEMSQQAVRGPLRPAERFDD